MTRGLLLVSLAAGTLAAPAPASAAATELAIQAITVRPAEPVVGAHGSVRLVIDVVARGVRGRNGVAVKVEPGAPPGPLLTSKPTTTDPSPSTGGTSPSTTDPSPSAGGASSSATGASPSATNPSPSAQIAATSSPAPAAPPAATPSAPSPSPSTATAPGTSADPNHSIAPAQSPQLHQPAQPVQAGQPVQGGLPVQGADPAQAPAPPQSAGPVQGTSPVPDAAPAVEGGGQATGGAAPAVEGGGQATGDAAPAVEGSSPVIEGGEPTIVDTSPGTAGTTPGTTGAGPAIGDASPAIEGAGPAAQDTAPKVGAQPGSNRPLIPPRLVWRLATPTPSAARMAGDWQTWRFLPDKRLSRYYPTGTWTVTATATGKGGATVTEYAAFQLKREARLSSVRVEQARGAVRLRGSLTRVDPRGLTDYGPFGRQRLEILWRPDTASSWEQVGETTTDAAGAFLTTIPGRTAGHWRVRYTGTEHYAPDASKSQQITG